MCNLVVQFVKCMELQRSSGDFCERDQEKTVVVVVKTKIKTTPFLGLSMVEWLESLMYLKQF